VFAPISRGDSQTSLKLVAESDPIIRVADATLVPAKKSRLRHALRACVMLVVPLLLMSGGYYYYRQNDHFVSTDNAYVQQDKVSVSAEVGGRIIQVAVKENDHVNAGDLLFRIDPTPFKIALEQAGATIAGAEAKVSTLETTYQTSDVDIESAREDVAFAQKEFDRQAALMQRGFTTRARLDVSRHALNDAKSRVASAQASAIRARAALSTGKSAAPGVNPGILSGQIQREKALWDLARTEVRAPVSGIISQSDRLQNGQMMVQGLPAVSIVASDHTWIGANFKETDLNKMKIGQRAIVTFDAYPDLKIMAHIESIGAGTGSQFSVLPAQNANGNWVKVTQRVPVRLVLDEKPARQMIAGLSVHVRVDTADAKK
jgi:membrane fusion protein, multidrug efflux system